MEVDKKVSIKNKRSEYGSAADVFAYGCLAYEVMTRNWIYKHGMNDGTLTAKTIYKNVMDGIMPDIREHCPDNDACPGWLIDLVGRCWLIDPARRVTAAGLVDGFADMAPSDGFSMLLAKKHVNSALFYDSNI